MSSSIQCQSCEPLLKSLLYQLKNVINCNSSKVLTVLQGTKLEAIFSKMNLSALEFTHEEGNFLDCLPELDACPLVITMLVCLLALLSVPQLTPIHWQQIEKQLLQYLHTQHQNTIMTVKRLMPQVCQAMQRELDSFRDSSLTELVKVIPGENDHLQDLVASVFYY